MRTASCIYTLGPKGTDASDLALSISDDVCFVDDFRQAMESAARSDGIALVPCGAIRSPDGTVPDSWVDLNFDFNDQLTITDLILRRTKPMALGRHHEVSTAASIGLQPSTEVFARRHAPLVRVVYFANKVAAVRACAAREVDMCIGSEDIIREHQSLTVLAVFQPTMVWALYARKDETSRGNEEARIRSPIS
jgi:hypothetical protein